MKKLLACLLFAACDYSVPAVGGGAVADDAGGDAPDAAVAPDLAKPFSDEDADGLDDAQELAWAHDYLPYLSQAPDDNCKVGGLLVRVRPHPQDPTLVHLVYDWLYDQDCGALGHAGDDEAFGVTIDPTKPAPDGIVAMTAVSHQGSPCERDSSCGRCAGQTACQTLTKNGVAWPALWPSKDKHGSYVNRGDSCTLLGTCFDSCADAPTPVDPPLVNAGEPGHPLVNDLTDHGFVTAANGWKNAELLHYDPWAHQDFGGAGDVTGDLTDDAFVPPACH